MDKAAEAVLPVPTCTAVVKRSWPRDGQPSCRSQPRSWSTSRPLTHFGSPPDALARHRPSYALNTFADVVFKHQFVDGDFGLVLRLHTPIVAELLFLGRFHVDQVGRDGFDALKRDGLSSFHPAAPLERYDPLFRP